MLRGYSQEGTFDIKACTRSALENAGKKERLLVSEGEANGKTGNTNGSSGK